MAVMISMEEQSALVLIRFSGMTSQEQVEGVLQEFLRLRAQTGVNRVLMDVSARSESLGLIELFEVAQMLSEPAFNGVRLAFYSDKPEPGLEFTRSVTNGKNCGADLRIFPCEVAARDWLTVPNADPDLSQEKTRPRKLSG